MNGRVWGLHFALSLFNWIPASQRMSLLSAIQSPVSFAFENLVLSILTTKQSYLLKQHYTASVVVIWLNGERKKKHQHALLHVRVDDCSYIAVSREEKLQHVHSIPQPCHRGSLSLSFSQTHGLGQKCCCSNCCQALGSRRW